MSDETTSEQTPTDQAEKIAQLERENTALRQHNAQIEQTCGAYQVTIRVLSRLLHP